MDQAKLRLPAAPSQPACGAELLANVLSVPARSATERDAAHVAQLAGRPLDLVAFLGARTSDGTRAPVKSAGVPGALLDVRRPDIDDPPREPRVRGGLPAQARITASLPARPPAPVVAFEPSGNDRNCAIEADLDAPRALGTHVAAMPWWLWGGAFLALLTVVLVLAA